MLAGINADCRHVGGTGSLTGSRSLVAAAVLLVTAGPLSAMQIFLGDFSPSASVINFDDLAGGSMNGTGTVVTDQYSALGVTFSDPDFAATANTFLTGFMTGSSAPNVLFVDQGGGKRYFPPFGDRFHSAGAPGRHVIRQLSEFHHHDERL
jgi:hypothetical protein